MGARRMAKGVKRCGAYTLADDVEIVARNGVLCVDVKVGDETVRLAAGYALAVRVVRLAAKALAKENVVAFEKRAG